MKYIHCTSTSLNGQVFPLVMLLKSKLCLMWAFSFFLSNSALSSLVVVREAGSACWRMTLATIAAVILVLRFSCLHCRCQLLCKWNTRWREQTQATGPPLQTDFHLVRIVLFLKMKDSPLLLGFGRTTHTNTSNAHLETLLMFPNSPINEKLACKTTVVTTTILNLRLLHLKQLIVCRVSAKSCPVWLVSCPAVPKTI